MRLIAVFFLALSFSWGSSSFAAAPSGDFDSLLKKISEYDSKEANTHFKENYAAWIKMGRSPASIDGSELERIAMRSSEFVKFSEDLRKVNSGDSFEKFLENYSAQFATLKDEQVKYFVAQLRPLMPLRGILWKLRPIFDAKPGLLGGIEYKYRGSKATHSAIVTVLRQVAGNIEAYLPSDQWRAGFDFIASPSAEKFTSKDQFDSFGDFQEFTYQVFVPVLERSIEDIAGILARSNAKTVFVWDNQLNHTEKSFPKGAEDGRWVGHALPEIHATLAAMWLLKHNAEFFAAYNYDDIQKVQRQIGTLFAIEESKNLGVSAEERWKILDDANKKFQFLDRVNDNLVKVRKKNLEKKFESVKAQWPKLTWRNTDGAARMKEAYGSLKAAVREAGKTYAYLSSGKSDEKTSHPRGVGYHPLTGASLWGLDAGYYNDANIRALGTGINVLAGAVLSEGGGPVRSNLTGETLILHVYNFYNASPESLLNLFPTAFNSCEQVAEARGGGKQPEEYVVKFKKDGKSTSYRNYFCGHATAWDNKTWGSYVMPVEGGSISDPKFMQRANETLMSSLGTNYLWIPMGNFF